MLLILRSFVLCIVTLWLCLHNPSDAEYRVLNMERPIVEYVNTSFGRLVNMTSRRLNRRDHVYYLQLVFETFVMMDKDYNVHISLDESISYTSTRRYLDLDFNYCKFMLNTATTILYKRHVEDQYVMRSLNVDCNMPIGYYCMNNLTWRSIHIPFTKDIPDGRFKMKMYSKDKTVVFSSHIDLTTRTITKRKM